jgi:hypothetical protein
MDGLKADAPDRDAIMRDAVLHVRARNSGVIVSRHLEAFLSG